MFKATVEKRQMATIQSVLVLAKNYSLYEHIHISFNYKRFKKIRPFMKDLVLYLFLVEKRAIILSKLVKANIPFLVFFP